jgi:hypothetical protein
MAQTHSQRRRNFSERVGKKKNRKKYSKKIKLLIYRLFSTRKKCLDCMPISNVDAWFKVSKVSNI